MDFRIEFELEDDGRWIAEIPELPGALAYGITQREAESKVQAIALRITADRLEQDNSTTEHVHVVLA